MEKKKVWRYYCDFCKKSNCSGAAMSKHEKHCTSNPDRECRMCETPRDYRELAKIMPERKIERIVGDGLSWGGYMEKWLNETECKGKVKDVWDSVEGCPICAWTVFKIAGHNPFDYMNLKSETEKWFQAKNEEALKQESYY